MFISKLTVQISSLYFMIILFTNTLLCGEVVENTQNELDNDVNETKSTIYTFLSSLKNNLSYCTSIFSKTTKFSVDCLKKMFAKPKPAVQRNHDPLKRVQEPFIKNRDNGIFLLEGLIVYILEYFCQNNYYIQDTDTEIVQKISEKIAKIMGFITKNNEEKKIDNDTTASDETTKDKATNDTSPNNTSDNTTPTNNTSINNEPDDELPKIFPFGVHLLSEKCFENGFLKCKDSDHTKEIFDLIFKDDEQIAKLISIDEKILKNVINFKKMYTISENNKIVEFLNLLLKNKPNDTYDRLYKSNKNGYNLIYPKADATISLVVCLLRGVIEKLKMNYEENEKRINENLNEQDVTEKSVAGQGLVNNQEMPPVNNQEIPLINNQDVPLVNNQFIPLRELEID